MLPADFSEKLKAAQELGIRIFVIKRPPLHPNFLSVNGKYGLRRTVEQYYPGFYPLRSGLTTGTCAAAAAAAAIWDIFNIQGTPRPPEFAVILPNGELIDVPVEPQQKYPRYQFHKQQLDSGVGSQRHKRRRR